MNEQPPSAPQRGSGLAFVQHWTWVADKGLMPRASALATRAAVSQILKVDEDWENLDIRQLDVDAVIARFRNLSKLAPASLATYESRFRSGLESYLAYLDNPASYSPKGRKAAARDDKPRSRTRNKGEVRALPSSVTPSATPQVSSGGARLVVYPFPVRPEVFAELKLPADLTVDEARRLGKFLEAVALAEAGDSRA